MTKRATKQQPRIVSAGDLSAEGSQILKDAKAGKRTVITHYNIPVAAVISADDLKTLEEAS